ncbi:MAG: di-heme oxidoredictase family protein, partial [Nitrospirales bacterium]|nr:di-heme oxidoredictase family protein [Nitrospirales bacterium]
ELADPTSRKTFKTWYIDIGIPVGFGETCDDTTSFNPRPENAVNWPTKCPEVNDIAIHTALTGSPQEPSATTSVVGHMHLLGHRLGNSPLIEMIPDKTIKATEAAQKTSLTFPGCYGLAAGTRNGGMKDGKYIVHYQTCSTGQQGDKSDECYISRFGWIGDRTSLEDQIANAASVEMNITSKESYESINPNPKSARELVRYKDRLCGPADKICTGDKGENLENSNSDITEQEIRDMATYQRWIGIPNRSEYQVSSTIVQEGEEEFKKLQCHSCHVIDKIVYVEKDNMLPDEERDRLNTLRAASVDDYPFISYLGTDLLLHDMGYLSQVAKAPPGMKIRNLGDGTVKEKYKAWVQKIRTPALKGLRFNRFVTDSIHKTKAPHFMKPNENFPTPPSGAKVACDFLLHDGRACDAIEAAYLHDGPAIKKLEMIKNLNNLLPAKLKALRAFLYSL